MGEAEFKSTYDSSAEHLPAWWRFLLIAMATIVLCSCSSPAVRTQLAADKTLTDAAPATPADNQGKPNPGVALHADPSMACQQCAYASPSAVDPYGPLVGPSDEYLCDGGDFITPAGVRADRTVVGVEPDDAISHYDTADGRILVTPSNRVCIYAPRFAAVRRVVEVMEHEQPVFVKETLEERSLANAGTALPPIQAKQRHALAVDLGQKPPSLLRGREQAGGLENLQASMDAFATLAPYANLEIIRTGEVSAAEKPRLERAMESAIALTGVQAPQVVFGVKMAQAKIGVRQPGVVYETEGPDHPRLRLCKLASTGHAAPGEEVEFTLRFDNIGDQVIANVTIVDSLSSRFEYVPGSSKSSVDAELVTESNDVGSLVLRWEIKEPVKPGEGGLLRFKVKVR